MCKQQNPQFIRELIMEESLDITLPHRTQGMSSSQHVYTGSIIIIISFISYSLSRVHSIPYENLRPLNGCVLCKTWCFSMTLLLFFGQLIFLSLPNLAKYKNRAHIDISYYIIGSFSTGSSKYFFSSFKNWFQGNNDAAAATPQSPRDDFPNPDRLVPLHSTLAGAPRLIYL